MFIHELFESQTQKTGPAGQARGTDKAPFRNKLVGEEGNKLPGESDEDYLQRRDIQRKKVGPMINLDARKGARNKDEVRKDYSDTIGNKPVKEATGLKKRVRIVAGPAKGRTGYVGEVRHGLYKGAPKTFTIDLDGGGNIYCKKEELRLIKGEALEQTPDQGSPDFAKPMFGENDPYYAGRKDVPGMTT